MINRAYPPLFKLKIQKFPVFHIYSHLFIHIYTFIHISLMLISYTTTVHFQNEDNELQYNDMKSVRLYLE